MGTRTIKFYMVLVGLFSLSSCYYDNEEDLFIGGNPCDTTDVTFAPVAEIFNTSCAYAGCHAPPSPSFNIDLSTYAEAIKVDGDQLVGSLEHDPNYFNMPQGGAKLPTCQINMVRAWVNQGKRP